MAFSVTSRDFFFWNDGRTDGRTEIRAKQILYIFGEGSKMAELKKEDFYQLLLLHKKVLTKLCLTQQKFSDGIEFFFRL